MSKAAELANLIGNINAGGGGVNRNVIINGAMNVAQRSTSETALGADTTTYRTVDRWKIDVNGTDGRFTMSQDSSAPSGFANSTKFDCTTADTSIAAGEFFQFQQRIEGQNLQAFAKGTSDAKPFAVSFYVKGNASATYTAELFDNDNSRQISKTFSVTTDWTRVELTYPADTTGAFDDDNASSLNLNIWLHAGSTYNSGTLNSSSCASNTSANRVSSGNTSFFDSTDRTFFITGVQLEVGQNPTSFEHEPIDVTEKKCFRYYSQDETSGRIGICSNSGATIHDHDLIAPMRATPSISLSEANIRVGDMVTAGFDSSSGTISLQTYRSRFSVAYTYGGFSGLTQYRAYLQEPRSGTLGFVKMDAEL